MAAKDGEWNRAGLSAGGRLFAELGVRLARGDGFQMRVTIDPQKNAVLADFMALEPEPPFARLAVSYDGLLGLVGPAWPFVEASVKTFFERSEGASWFGHRPKSPSGR